jgi:predicted Zn-dependent peptidase
MFWESGPYGWHVLGWPSDIRSITREDARRYRELYYGPHNATALFIGDFDPDELFELFERYFGPISSNRGRKDKKAFGDLMSRLRGETGPSARGMVKPPDVTSLEIEQVGNKQLMGEAEASPQVEIRFHTVAFQHPDSYPLEVLAGVLSGKSGRLYKKLVIEDGIALSGSVRQMMGPSLHVGASQYSMKYAGYFSVFAEGKDEVSPLELRDAVYAILDDLKDNPVTEYELEKVKNQVIADNVKLRRRFQGIGLMFYLGQYAAQGDWREINTGMERLLDVTPSDIERVVDKYFGKWKRNELLIFPKEVEEGAVRLDPQMKQFLTMIESMEDTDQLGRILGMIQMRMDGAESDDEREQAMVLYDAAKKRLESLKSEEDM